MIISNCFVEIGLFMVSDFFRNLVKQLFLFCLIKKETKNIHAFLLFFGIHESSISSLALPRRSN